MKLPLSSRLKIGFQDQLSLYAGQKYCRMLQGEHSAILSTFIKLPFVIKIFVLSIFEWPFHTGFYCNFQIANTKGAVQAGLLFVCKNARFSRIEAHIFSFIFQPL